MNKEALKIITTKHRGVFVGRVVDRTDGGRTVTLADCVCVIYWGTTNGLLQLADKGPTDKTKLSSVCPRAVLRDVTAEFDIREGVWPTQTER